LQAGPEQTETASSIPFVDRRHYANCGCFPITSGENKEQASIKPALTSPFDFRCPVKLADTPEPLSASKSPFVAKLLPSPLNPFP
jgi:hypothetical protein